MNKEMNLKEALCAMVDGKKVRLKGTTDHHIEYKEGCGFRYFAFNKYLDAAMGVLSKHGTYVLIDEEEEEIYEPACVQDGIQYYKKVD